MARPKRIKWNLPAFEEVRRMPGVDERLKAEVDRVINQLGNADYAGGVDKGRTRSRGYVVTTTFKAMLREHREHLLLKALGGGRG
jgi:hypothetical protein